MKKLLLITLLLVSVFSFAQQKDNATMAIKNNTIEIETLTLISATPNPFTVNTEISFTSSNEQNLSFSVKNILGKTVFNKRLIAKKGSNTISFERNDIAKGMYIYTLQTESEVFSKRLVIR